MNRSRWPEIFRQHQFCNVIQHTFNKMSRSVSMVVLAFKVRSRVHQSINIMKSFVEREAHISCAFKSNRLRSFSADNLELKKELCIILSFSFVELSFVELSFVESSIDYWIECNIRKIEIYEPFFDDSLGYIHTILMNQFGLCKFLFGTTVHDQHTNWYIYD